MEEISPGWRRLAWSLLGVQPEIITSPIKAVPFNKLDLIHTNKSLLELISRVDSIVNALSLSAANFIVPFVILRLAFSGIVADLGSMGWSAGEPQRAERGPQETADPNGLFKEQIRSRREQAQIRRDVEAKVSASLRPTGRHALAHRP